MDWKRFVECFDSMTCILSVEKGEDGRCGKIRYAAGNERYIESLSLAAGGVSLGKAQRLRIF